MGKRIKQYTIMLILVFAVLACGGGYDELSSPSNNCSNPVSDSSTNQALSQISFYVPQGWTEIKSKQQYATGPALLNVFVFNSSGTSAKSCVETMVEVVSAQSIVDNYKINSSEFSVNGAPAVMAVADGYSDSSRETPFRGIYTGFENDNWIYVFTWDAFGLDAVGSITDDAIFTIQSIKITR